MKRVTTMTAAALLLAGAAYAGDKSEWSQVTEEQWMAMAEAGTGEWLGEGMSRPAPDAEMEASTSRMATTFEDGVLKAKADNDNDGEWDYSWTESYADGGYVKTTADGTETKVDLYVTDYESASNYKSVAKWTSSGEDGTDYSVKMYWNQSGAEGEFKVKMREAGTEGDWTVMDKGTATKMEETA